MKNLILAAIFASTSVSAQLNSFNPSESIKAQKINSNFSVIENILDAKNGNVNFSIFNSGELITREGLEAEFAKVRLLGIQVRSLGSEKIASSELNGAFTDMLTGANVFDDVPSAQDFSLVFDEDQAQSNKSFTFTNAVGQSQVIIVSPPLHGSLVLMAINLLLLQPLIIMVQIALLIKLTMALITLTQQLFLLLLIP